MSQFFFRDGKWISFQQLKSQNQSEEDKLNIIMVKKVIKNITSNRKKK